MTEFKPINQEVIHKNQENQVKQDETRNTNKNLASTFVEPVCFHLVCCLMLLSVLLSVMKLNLVSFSVLWVGTYLWKRPENLVSRF